MLRQRLAFTTYVCGFTVATALATGCARDLTLEDPVNPADVTIAQFDPTNPIPVLQLIPAPTALAQIPGTKLINKAAVAPEPCELPTIAQCLAFVDGWSTTTYPTLYFSKAPDQASLQQGIIWLEVGATGIQPVEFTAVIRERDAINPACMSGDNGSNPAQTYTADDVPAGVQVNLIPTSPLKPGTQYLMALVSNEGGGLRGPDGDQVYPSALFAILNTDDPPVAQDGTITDGLLRSQAQGAAIARLYPNTSPEELDADQQAAVAAAVAASGETLVGLYAFISQVSSAFLDAGLVMDRNDLVFVNSWDTGEAAAAIEFDPQAGIVPIPNTQLLTVENENTPTGLQVSFPRDPSNPTRDALIGGLNTLDGFGLSRPVMTVSVNAVLDASTLQDNIAMYAVNSEGNATGPSVPLAFQTTTTTTATTASTTINIVAFGPLPQSTDFAVVLKRGIMAADGREVQRNSTFNLLALDDNPFVDESGAVQNPVIEQALQCQPVPVTGMLAQDPEVRGTAAALETLLNHAGWTTTLTALENHTDPAEAVAREDIIMAWGYTTQTLTGAVGTAKQLIQSGTWDMAVPGPKALGPLPPSPIVGTASIAATVQVVPQFCVPICEVGTMEPGIDRDDCVTRDMEGNITSINPALPGNQFCQLAVNIIAGNLNNASLYAVKSYELRAGNPYVAGTFDPAKFAAPDASTLLVWVIEPNGTPPAEGWPVVMFQHGIGQFKETGFYLANSMANLGIATVLMDLPLHGSRASDLAMLVDTPLGPQEVPCTDANGIPNIDPADVMCDPATGMCQGGCDGVRDSSATGFLSTNLFGTRDNLRQATIDQLALIDAIQEASMTGGPLERLDGTSIGYIGQSLGAITGGNLAAYADGLGASVLNVGGGDWVTILEQTVPQISAPLFVGLANAGVCTLINPANPGEGCVRNAAYLEFLNTLRWILEPADPVPLSQAVPDGLGLDNVLIQMATDDPVVPNAATALLAASYGLADLDLRTGTATPTSDRFQIYDFTALPQSRIGSGCHGWILQPTCGGFDMNGDLDVADALCNSIGAQLQAGEFLLNQMSVADQRPATVSGIPCP
jgi:hypothetical protein